MCWVCWCYDQECTLSHCVCVGFVGAMIRSVVSHCVCVGAMIRSVVSHCVCVGFVGAMIRSVLSLTVCVLGLLVL